MFLDPMFNMLSIHGRIINATRRMISLSSTNKVRAAYEGEGKTTVKVLNQDLDAGLMINSYANYGFRLNNGITILGSMALFPRTALSWQISNSTEITPESLKFFKLLEPKIDLVVIGLDTNERSMLTKVFRAAKEIDLNVEILPTEHACSTFNFLNAEGRSVAAALIPPMKVTMNEDDHLETGLHYGDMYNKPMF